MKAIERFFSTMKRSKALLTVYRDGDGAERNDDFLRFAIVLSVAAFERYVKDAFLAHLVTSLRKEPCNENLQKLVVDSGITSDFWRQCILKKTPHPFQRICNAVKRHLFAFPCQKKSAIDGLFKCYSLGSLVDNTRSKSRRKTLWRSIEWAVKRRHQIVHAGDCGNMGHLALITIRETEHRLDDIELFVTNMDEIVRNKFSRKKKRRKKKPRASTRKRNPISY